MFSQGSDIWINEDLRGKFGDGEEQLCKTLIIKGYRLSG